MAEGSQSSRPDAGDIYDRVRDDARQELGRGKRALALSALFAGFTMGATPLAYAAAMTYASRSPTGGRWARGSVGRRARA